MKLPLNFDLMRSPLNWAILLLMVAIGSFALNEILRFAGAGGDCGCRQPLQPVPPEASATE